MLPHTGYLHVFTFFKICSYSIAKYEDSNLRWLQDIVSWMLWTLSRPSLQLSNIRQPDKHHVVNKNIDVRSIMQIISLSAWWFLVYDSSNFSNTIKRKPQGSFVLDKYVEKIGYVYRSRGAKAKLQRLTIQMPRTIAVSIDTFFFRKLYL